MANNWTLKRRHTRKRTKERILFWKNVRLENAHQAYLSWLHDYNSN